MAPRPIRFRPSRQAALFLVTLALPCSLLVLLTVRMLVQERELTEKRAADERRRLTTDIRQRLLADLERLRIAGERAHADVALVAPVEDGALVLPWQSNAATVEVTAALHEPAFRELVRRGEQREFAEQDFTGAGAAYRAAAASARQPVQRAAAELLAARALLKAGRFDGASGLVGRLLNTPATLVDDQGVPYAVYAARLVGDHAVRSRKLQETISASLGRLLTPATSPATAYMIRDVAGLLSDRRLAASAASRARDIEQALELQKAFPRLALPVATPGIDPVWVTFGPAAEKWLVSLASSAGAPVLTAVRAAPVFARLDAAIRVDATAAEDTLAPNFPGLRASIAESAMHAASAERRLQRQFYVSALVLVVFVAGFGAYLFWRDVRREMRLAEMRSQFVSSVSHELKTPLTAIRMFAETLMLGRSTALDVQHEYLETIVNESERLARLLNNVLDFSRIEQGRKTYRLAPLSPASVVRAAVKAMQYPFAQQGFELRVQMDDSLPAVAGDPDALEQAILNLLSNAMKYSGEGRVIDVVLERDGERAVIAVTDRGIGIPAAEQTRIFERFYRVPDSAHQGVPGTGLGLTLVEHVVKAHGGQVTVRSAPGKGSTFSIVLPFAPSAALSESSALA
jgi:signal transduction histidine kinase